MPVVGLRAFRYQLDHVADPGSEDGHIHDHEHDQRYRKFERRVVRYRVLRPHRAIDHPGLASDLGGDPSGQEGHQTRGAHQPRQAQKKLRPEELIAPACPGGPNAKQQHEQAKPDHAPEGTENDRGVGPVLGCEILQAANLVVPAMGQDEAAQVRNLQGITCFFFQAEDGIRDSSVTGVQTCALPISALPTLEAHLFTSRSAIRTRMGHSRRRRYAIGENPPDGAAFYYYLKEEPKDLVKLELLDAQGDRKSVV